MKTTIKFTLIGALGILSGVTLFAQAASDDGPSPGGRPEPERSRPESRREMLLGKYDANKDGKLDDTEASALGKDFFEGKLPPPRRGPGGPDERGPGFGPPRHGPDGRDFGASRQGGPREEFEPGPGPRGPRHGELPGPSRGQMPGRRGFERDGDGEPPRFRPGPHGPGRPDSEEGRKMIEEHRRDFLKKYDANGDGKLSSKEREAIGKDIEDGKLPPPPLHRIEGPKPNE